MTLEQKNDALDKCCKTHDCWHTENGCPIEDLCEQCYGDFKAHPALLDLAYGIVEKLPMRTSANPKVEAAQRYCDAKERCADCPAYEWAYDKCDFEEWTAADLDRFLKEINPDKPAETPDLVNHPSHYCTGNIECIDAMKSAFGAEDLRTYCKINAFKYVWRAKHKNGEQDIEKAIWYLNKYVELGGELDGQLTLF